jgi:hypothetical protein
MTFQIKPSKQKKLRESTQSYLYSQTPEVSYNPDTSENTYSFRKKNDNSYTVEVSNFYDEENNETVWIVFHAKDGQGVENSPDIFYNEYDALQQAKVYSKEKK